jgi:predicted peptidase
MWRKRSMTAAIRIIAGVVLVISATVEIRAQTVELFEAREYRSTEGQFQGTVFRYRLFVPRSMKPGQRYPLLVWMHGHGIEPGTDNARHLLWIDLMLNDRTHPEKYRFFVLAVQCPANHRWFGQTAADGGSPDDMLSVTTDILRETMLGCPVDRDRVYLVGISSGAAAAWEMAMRHPRLFAAVVPLACASGSDESRAARLVKIPIWAFINHGERKGVESMVNAVQAAGGNACLTVADAFGHDAWSTPLRGGILEWILAQRRGAFC